MTMSRKKLGAFGESVAATHLEARGYMIVERNWRCEVGEVDIIAKKGEHWAFVEVKTRKNQPEGAPEQAITKKKGERLGAISAEYLTQHDLDDDLSMSIDLVAVELDAKGVVTRIEHIPDMVWGW